MPAFSRLWIILLVLACFCYCQSVAAEEFTDNAVTGYEEVRGQTSLVKRDDDPSGNSGSTASGGSGGDTSGSTSSVGSDGTASSSVSGGDAISTTSTVGSDGSASTGTATSDTSGGSSVTSNTPSSGTGISDGSSGSSGTSGDGSTTDGSSGTNTTSSDGSSGTNTISSDGSASTSVTDGGSASNTTSSDGSASTSVTDGGSATNTTSSDGTSATDGLGADSDTPFDPSWITGLTDPVVNGTDNPDATVSVTEDTPDASDDPAPDPTPYTAGVVGTELALTNITVTDATNTLRLMPSDNGNLNITRRVDLVGGNDWSLSNNTIVGDTIGRYLLYFPDTMSAFGVSRLRLAPWGGIPLGSRTVFLSQMGNGTNHMLVGIDTTGAAYYLILCLFLDQHNKIFLSNDTVLGPTALQSASLRYIMTGGVVDSCSPIALNSSAIVSTT